MVLCYKSSRKGLHQPYVNLFLSWQEADLGVIGPNVWTPVPAEWWATWARTWRQVAVKFQKDPSHQQDPATVGRATSLTQLRTPTSNHTDCTPHPRVLWRTNVTRRMWSSLQRPWGRSTFPRKLFPVAVGPQRATPFPFLERSKERVERKSETGDFYLKEMKIYEKGLFINDCIRHRWPY